MKMTARQVRSLVQYSRSKPEKAPTPSTTGDELPPASSCQIDNFTIGAIRRHVHGMFSAKQVITVNALAEDLKKSNVIPKETSRTAVLRILHSMGFRYKTSQRKMYVRKESLDIICKRVKALRALKEHRREGRKVVYVDETWFTTRMHHSKEWIDSTQPDTSSSYSRQVPPGEGERFVVVGAGTDQGFVEDSFLYYAAKNKSGDYHGEMNSTIFLRWLTSQLLPMLEGPSVLVMDNAPYHSQLTEESRCPNTATKKADLLKWLESHRIPYPPYVTACVQAESARTTVKSGHPEINAIEQVWGCMKIHIRSSLQRFTRADLNARLEEVKLPATRDVWAGAVRRSRTFEDEFWSSYNVLETVCPIIIDVESNEEDDFFLNSDDSDEDYQK